MSASSELVHTCRSPKIQQVVLAFNDLFNELRGVTNRKACLDAILKVTDLCPVLILGAEPSNDMLTAFRNLGCELCTDKKHGDIPALRFQSVGGEVGCLNFDNLYLEGVFDRSRICLITACRQLRPKALAANMTCYVIPAWIAFPVVLGSVCRMLTGEEMPATTRWTD